MHTYNLQITVGHVAISSTNYGLYGIDCGYNHG